jgi:hypothetical protein
MRFFVIIETSNSNITRDEFPEEAMASWLDAVLDARIKPVTVYSSLEDLNADHLLDALAGTSNEESTS